MARLTQIVVLNHPSHFTQRGNGLRTFFHNEDHARYRDWPLPLSGGLAVRWAWF
ncbi:hypothetical protein ACQR16_32910 [Bradyrhizobium oligotrophicum]|uniref:hypothetical protein n=1 Tax=Bradyrhizobium oligotrophicum TaxID=44255 RepID=UPI003EBDBF35